MALRRACLLAAFATLGAAREASADATTNIVVDVSTFRNTRGMLGCQLYDTSVGFPDKWSTAPGLQKRIPVTGVTTTCTFNDMPPGTYAVAVLHDENSNNKLDTNFLGIPLEGYGMSNNHTHALRRPTWNESKFVAAAAMTVTLRVTLRY
jgi:uncharacterized protein (DUF2141 family)